MKKIIFFALFCALFVGCEKKVNIFVDESYSLVGLDSTKVSFKKKEDMLFGAQKSPCLLVFLSTWCEYCLGQAQHIANLDVEFGERVNIYGVFVDKGEQVEDLRAFVKDSNTQFTWFYKGDIARLLDSYEIKTFPFMLLYDAEGNLVQSYDGITPEEMIAFDIARVLK